MNPRASVSGRMANVLSRRLPRMVNRFSRRQARRFERTNGRRGAKLRGKAVFRLTVVGRKTGQPRSLMLMLVRRGDDLLVCGSQAGTPEAPNWWKNLMAAGTATVQVDEESWDVDAREITDPAERSDAWDRLVATYPDFATYQQLTDRTLPIAVLTRRS